MVTLRLTKTERNRLKVKAAQHDLSVNKYLRKLLGLPLTPPK